VTKSLSYEIAVPFLILSLIDSFLRKRLYLLLQIFEGPLARKECCYLLLIKDAIICGNLFAEVLDPFLNLGELTNLSVRDRWYFGKGCSYFLRVKFWLFEWREMTTAWHLRKSLHIQCALCPLTRDLHASREK